MRRQKIPTPSVRPRLHIYTVTLASLVQQFPGMQQVRVVRGDCVGEVFDRRIEGLSGLGMVAQLVERAAEHQRRQPGAKRPGQVATQG